MKFRLVLHPVFMVAGAVGLALSGCYDGPVCQSDDDCFAEEFCDENAGECVSCEDSDDSACTRHFSFDSNCDGTPGGPDVGLPEPTGYWPFDVKNQRSHPNAASDSGEPPLVTTGSDATAVAEGVAGDGVRTQNNSYATIEHHSVFDARDGTVMFWFRFSEFPEDSSALFSKDAHGLVEGGHLTIRASRTDDDNLRIGVRLQSAVEESEKKSEDTLQYELDSSPSDGWHHVAVSFGAEGFRLYVDGTEEKANLEWDVGLWSEDGNQNEEPVGIGVDRTRSPSGGWSNLRHYFDGTIDEIAVFGEQIVPGEYVEACSPSD